MTCTYFRSLVAPTIRYRRANSSDTPPGLAGGRVDKMINKRFSNALQAVEDLASNLEALVEEGYDEYQHFLESVNYLWEVLDSDLPQADSYA
jgi:hypothetical protein